MEFKNTFDSQMKRLGLSNYQLSKDTGISDSLIGYWRSGKRKPTLDNLIILAKYFNVTLDYLVFGGENTSIMLGTDSLSNDERELIETYNKLDRRGQHRVHTIIYEELDRIESQTYNESAISQGSYLFSDRHETPTFVSEDTHDYGTNHTHSISVLGYVAAGEPILSFENNINTVVPENPKASYALIAKGNSMEPIIMDGEVIEVISQKELENGEIGIIKVDNAVTCKCFYSLDCDYELKSLNPNNDPIIIEKDHCSNVQIVGKVALTIHQQERYNSLYKKVK